MNEKNSESSSIETIKSKKIMVVDDDRALLDIVTEIFSKSDFELFTATGADECMAHLRKGFRGLILMDVIMPKKNGWDTIREIKSAGLLEGNVIVMLTGLNNPDWRMEGLQEVVIDYIRKPFESQDLIAAARKYCGYLEHSKIGS